MSEQPTKKQGQTFIEKRPSFIKKLNVKKHKKPLFITGVIIGILLASLGGYNYWKSRYYISPEEEAKVLEEAKSLLAEGKVEEAGEKYQFVIDKKLDNSKKAKIYDMWSITCGDYIYYDCSLNAWQKKGEITTKDYKYYLTLGNLYGINGDESNSQDAYRNAVSDASERNDLTEEEAVLIEEIKGYLNGDS